jgi:hypothetical protein
VTQRHKARRKTKKKAEKKLLAINFVICGMEMKEKSFPFLDVPFVKFT